MAIKNRAFLSILRLLISFFNSLISAFSKPISFEFMTAFHRKHLKFLQNLITNSVRQQKLLMTHASVSANSHRAECNLSAIFKLKNELDTHFERNSPNEKKIRA